MLLIHCNRSRVFFPSDIHLANMIVKVKFRWPMIECFNTFKVGIISVVIQQTLHHLPSLFVVDSFVQKVTPYQSDILAVCVIIKDRKRQ